MPTILCVVGARPNFMKIAPLMSAFRCGDNLIEAPLVHTGQHYDEAMKRSFFDQLGIPEPDVDLEVGPGSHAVQTAEIMRRFEPVLDRYNPDAILVVGDVNSTIACALVATKKGVPVIHVEAGLRSYDRDMPEEINRILTDQISDVLFTTEEHAEANLVKEGIASDKVYFVGNVMIDTLHANLKNAVAPAISLQKISGADDFISGDAGYGLVTMHRPSNVDDAATLSRLVGVLAEVSQKIPLIFPVHPRTRDRLQAAGLMEELAEARMLCLPPMGYLDLLGLMKDATLVLTDSGGIQEETTALGVPCITMRENTERPITVTAGTNTVVGRDPELIKKAVEDVLNTGGKRGRIPPLWDGQAAERIKSALLEIFPNKPSAGAGV